MSNPFGVLRISTPETQYAAQYPYKTWGTYMTGIGTLIPGVTGKLIKLHQYSLSVAGTIAFSLNNAKPLGGTVDYGGFLTGGVIASPSSLFNKPFVPYPGYLCATTQVGSALCLGTYTVPTLGTVFFQAIYTDYDAT